MRTFNLLSGKGIAVIVLALTGCLFTGCGDGTTRVQRKPSKPVFFPPSPETPRLQFLTMISGAEEFGVARQSAFSTFITGEAEKPDDSIGSPYGMALSNGKLYVCDIENHMVAVIDRQNKSFKYLTKDRRMTNPVNIYIDNGKKYIADPIAGAIFVFDENDALSAILGKELQFKPIDVFVQGQKCFVADTSSNQVVILDKTTGKELQRIGSDGDGDGQFKLIAGLALDTQGNIYVTDKVKGVVAKFDSAGVFQENIGFLDTSIHGFVRPRGIDIDREGRIWVVDAATDVGKVYNSEGRLLMFFGMPGNLPGMINLPTDIIIDYDHVDLFKEDAVQGAEIEFLVLVASQAGSNKINVYGFGKFPGQQ